MTDAESALAYEGVSRSFGDYRALDNVSFRTRSGHILGLLGKNGAGKTTLIRLALDIFRPDTGQVLLFGAHPNRRALERVAYLPEERGLYRKTSVRRMLTYLGRLRGVPPEETIERCAALLDRLGVPDVLDKATESLSKGMTQKVQLAGALFSEPELCILDEPFSGLDPASASAVRSLIRMRNKPGLTTILSTHMMNQVEEVCDDVVVLHKGTVVASGTTAGLLNDDRQLALEIIGDGIVEAPGVRLSRDGGTLLASLPPGMPAHVYVKGQVDAGARIDAIQPKRPTMEELFLRLTEEP